MLTKQELPPLQNPKAAVVRTVSAKVSKNRDIETWDAGKSNSVLSHLDDFISIDILNKFIKFINDIPHDHSLEYNLKCIPNGGKGQHYYVWLAMGMAMHRETRLHGAYAMDTGLEIFTEWSRCSDKNDADTLLLTMNSFEKSFREVGYNRSTICPLAKKCQPHLFEINLSEFDDFSEYRKRNLVTNYRERFVPEYYNHRFIFERNPMGTGKTFQLSNHIKRNSFNRICRLSPRVSFAKNFTADLNRNLAGTGIVFSNYSLLVLAYVVIQMESLFKLDLHPESFQEYDLLIMDEGESNLNSFNSHTMQTPTSSNVDFLLKDTFEKLLRTSGQCIFLDAFLSKRTIETILTASDIQRNVNKENLINIRINEWHPSSCIAYEHGSYKNSRQELFFWGSKKRGKEFVRDFVHEFKTSKRCKYYHADGDDANDNDLVEVDNKWTEDVDCLMYTGKITVGVNFGIKDYYNALHVFGTFFIAISMEMMTIMNRT
ncbi:hypothetical protein BDK51DRAFT_29657 [Blyttiomyces helicus]|uniref:Replication origin-binding protein domain-containing protein n=1 Tax=Blyttiomyces helicus TaxID=388810 RepID=A0A4P9WMR2_9FUNG|nr:hypothetical protein BDK51DRAFT_29657 [Blyttiomyces helicus]|eukprot:RKO93782.1 hypothetical protein BDK51DRAFT_29657 [Blyttiomyces helicus]